MAEIGVASSESVEALLAQVLSLSGSSGELARLYSILEKFEQYLRSQASRLEPFLVLLDPAQNSLGFLFLLEAYSSGLGEQAVQTRAFQKFVVKFINCCSPEQIRLAPDKFTSVCRRFKALVVKLQVPIQGIVPLRTAVHKLQSSSGHVTALHSEFLLLCIVAKCYKAGSSILEEDISEFDGREDLFLYFYYGGMINIGLKLFGKALEYLHYVLTAPMEALTAIAIEAYKKHILVSLIYNGQPYIHFADCYTTGKYSELEASLQKNKAQFQSDSNLGLAKQALASLCKRSFQRFTRAYVVLSLQDIASREQLNTAIEAEIYVLRMIHGGEIFAKISQKDGMVTFTDNPKEFRTWEDVERLDSSIKRLMTLQKRMRSINEEFTYNPKYLRKIAEMGSRSNDSDSDDSYSAPAGDARAIWKGFV